MAFTVYAIVDSVEYSLGALFVGEETHRSGAASYFPEIPLQHVRGPYLLP